MTWKTFLSPAEKIAGGRALLWGVAGLAVCAVCAVFNGVHPNGLLNFGPSPANAVWLPFVEYLIIWLVPAAIFYGLGAALSSSRVRPIDVFGTAAFALLPLVAVNLTQLLPPIRDAYQVLGASVLGEAEFDMARIIAVTTEPVFMLHLPLLVAAIVLMFIWLFHAVRVACNLRGGRLWGVFLAGAIGGDFLCKLLIGLIR